MITIINIVKNGRDNMETQSKRHSKQRDAIIAYLAGTTSHPTADEVYAAVKDELPNIGIATVYRNLNQLSADGEIRKIECGTVDRFDYRTADHGHFTCRRCGRVSDVFMDFAKMEALADVMPGKPDFCEMMFYGICKECLTSMKST